MRSWLKAFSILFVVASLLFMTLPVAAQMNSAVRGSLGGVVFDATGSVLPNADVAITGPQGEYKVKTDSMGHYVVGDLVPGSYTVKVEAKGFKTYVSQRNLVVANATSSLDVHLQVGAVTDTVTVEAGAVQIDTESTALTTPLTDQLYQTLPLARNVSGMFALAAGVVSGGATDTTGNPTMTNPSIGGASGLENLYLVDGVNVTDLAFGGFGTYSRQLGALGTGVNLAFIKEVDIKTTAFEPQYGKAAGGIVEIVTKSGSTAYHGAIAAYMGPGAWYADRHQVCQLGWIKTAQPCLYSLPGYDISGEFGGYVPGFKNKMFFFGAFDPAVSQQIEQAQPGTPLNSHGTYNFSLNERSWAGKITYNPWTNTQIEASSFGDPSFHNSYPTTLAAQSAAAVAERYNFDHIDSVFRLDQTISPSWVVNGSFTYNIQRFNQLPQYNNYQISDRSVSPFIIYYVGAYEPDKSDDYTINLSTQKIFNFLGQHTLSVGYSYDHTNFLDQPLRSGPLFPIPGTNAAGQSLVSSFGSHAGNIGQMTNAQFRMFATDSGCTYCAKVGSQYVYLQEIRGTFKGLSVLAMSRYHVGWANDSYQMNRHINIDAGLRWEEQWYDGSVMKFLFNDNWSPRLGINWDPKGDRRTKLFFNYARYQSVLPLDAAIRQLGNEQDDDYLYFAPKSDSSGNMLRDSNGSPIVVADAAHTLNGTQSDLAGDSFGTVSWASSTGEGIIPGTRMEYENEYTFGMEREISPGSMLGIRYTDRRLGRIVEDVGSQGPEGSLVDSFYNGGIANVSASTDLFKNESEAVYTPAQWTAANGTDTPGMFASGKNTHPYVAPVTGCSKAGDTTIANGGFFLHPDGSQYNGACVTNLSTAGGNGPDGKPDGFADPIRRYQEFVIEYARNMKNNWQMRSNFRYARLYGNYEGFFRNDNGQSDPGISSLFDFTTGSLGLLGDQFAPGLLNTDRRMVFNLDASYMVNAATPWISGVKGLTLGANVRGQSGTPLSAFASHPIYGNTGEVPIGGRGTKGQLPSTRQLDLHADYPLHIRERYSIKFAFDAFNITNTQLVTGRSQNLDTSVGVSSPDYNKVSQYQGPFHAQASVKFEF